MIASFEIPPDDVGLWTGVAGGTYSLFQCLSAIPWGRLSDVFGRKPIILISLGNTMVTSLMWGFSTSLPMAITSRALSGMGNGNVGIIRTVVAEMCPWKELQPRAFSIMPLVYNAGSVLGPTIGGALSNPYHLKPGEHRSSALLDRFPYAAPNLVAAGFFMVSIVTGFLFLQETLESKRGQRDWGLDLGKKLTTGIRSFYRRRVKSDNDRAEDDETDSLIKPPNGDASTSTLVDEEQAQEQASRPSLPAPPFRDVLTKQSVLNLACYALLALHSLAFDTLIPVFLYHRKRDLNDPDVHLPFRFNGGFGKSNAQIGFMFTMYGIMNIFFQFVVFPPTAQRFGVLLCTRISFILSPIIFFFIPFTVLLPGNWGIASLFFLWTLKGLAGAFAFPCSTILLTNSASSLRILGTLNGVATSVGAVGRALGPLMAGNAFTYGVKHLNFVILPFWILSAIGFLGAFITFFLVEGKGFGNDDPADGTDTEDEEDNELGVEAVPEPISGSIFSTAAPTSGRRSEYGTLSRSMPASLARAWSAGSSAVFEGDDENTSSDDAPRERRISGRRRLSRKSSIPIGGGPGFKRLSSNLGHGMSNFGH